MAPGTTSSSPTASVAGWRRSTRIPSRVAWLLESDSFLTAMSSAGGAFIRSACKGATPRPTRTVTASQALPSEAQETRDGVALTNLDQPLFDGSGATKRDLVDYLDAVRERIIPELEGRPLSVIRV